MKKCFFNSWLMVEINNAESILKFITFECFFAFLLLSIPIVFNKRKKETKKSRKQFFASIFNRQMSDKKAFLMKYDENIKQFPIPCPTKIFIFFHPQKMCSRKKSFQTFFFVHMKNLAPRWWRKKDSHSMEYKTWERENRV